jgi:hypothetical protein
MGSPEHPGGRRVVERAGHRALPQIASSRANTAASSDPGSIRIGFAVEIITLALVAVGELMPPTPPPPTSIFSTSIPPSTTPSTINDI